MPFPKGQGKQQESAEGKEDVCGICGQEVDREDEYILGATLLLAGPPLSFPWADKICRSRCCALQLSFLSHWRPCSCATLRPPPPRLLSVGDK